MNNRLACAIRVGLTTIEDSPALGVQLIWPEGPAHARQPRPLWVKKYQRAYAHFRPVTETQYPWPELHFGGLVSTTQYFALPDDCSAALPAFQPICLTALPPAAFGQ